MLAWGDSALRFSRLFERSLGAILMYHSIGEPLGNVFTRAPTVDEFERQMVFLRETCDVVRLRDFFTDARERPERKRVAITFDDGYMNFFTHALPVLVRHKIPSTVFVITGRIGEESYMRVQELQDIAKMPLVDIGNHGRLHVDQSHAPLREVLESEIVGAKEDLESLLGSEVSAFAYPFGEWSEVSREIVARSHALAVTATPGVIEATTDRYLLDRVDGAKESFSAFRFDLTDLRYAIAKFP